MNRYTKKQLKIVSVFLVVILIIVGIVWFLNKPTRGTCFDEFQNQRETGIDCGGPCGPCENPQDLVVVSSGIIPSLENNFDLVVKIKNPNNQWGVELLNYNFSLYDSNNQLIGSRKGVTYILPQETKYIIEPRINLEKTPDKVDLRLENVSWLKLKNFEEIELRIKEGTHQLTEEGFNKLGGIVENKSNYDLSEIEIIGVLFNGDEIVAAGKTQINTVLTDETRYFEINWPYEISADSFDIKPYTNIYLNDNFLKTHGTPEKFKEY